MKIYIYVIGLVFLFSQDAFCISGKTENASVQLNNEITGEQNSLAALSLPAARAYYLYTVYTDSSDTSNSQFPVWQRKIINKESYSPRNKNKAGFRRFVKPGLIVSAIALNWTSFYLKRRADNFYSDYQRTSNINRMNNKYKKAALYDDLSNIALGAAVTSLSAFFFIILTE